jgi:NEDD8-activating enzyme E1
MCAGAEFDSNGAVDMSTIKPLVDGGTEGLRGHARVIYPGVSPCFECTLWLFPPQVKFPLCTLAETPRSPAHCIEYAHLILWGRVHDEEFDSDNEEHMMWVCPWYLLKQHTCAPPQPLHAIGLFSV